MTAGSFREFLAAAEQAGRLKRVAGPVDPLWEPGSLVKWVFQGLPPAQRFGLRFDRVGDSPFPLVTGALGASVDSYAQALGVAPAGINDRWEQALLQPVPPVVVRDAPCQAVVLTGGDVDLGRLPIPVWTPGRDPAPYLTTCVVNRHAGTGVQNMGVYRTRVRGADSVIVNLAPGRQGHACAQTDLLEGRPSPIAWVIGAEPAVYLAAVANLPMGVDELTVAGALMGAPIELVKARTSDLLVPANAEFVIEGEVLPGVMEPEGPFGESAGYMSDVEARPVARITAITHRRDAIFCGLASQIPPSESTTLQSLSNAALIRKLLRHDHGEPTVRDAWIDGMFGGGASHIVISMTPRHPGHAREVGRLVARTTSLKRVTVVDEDIDVHDREDLDWVMSSHVDPQRDVEILTGFPAAMDHSVTPDAAGRKLGSKLVVDATRSLDTGTVSLPPAGLMDRALA
ncbi:MAG: UbiD family decarboxylase, partial [Gammaproteobacteria bacterium]|nr:UbiD family decarboxylase [Gammaproteobacteria bacterium]